MRVGDIVGGCELTIAPAKEPQIEITEPQRIARTRDRQDALHRGAWRDEHR